MASIIANLPPPLLAQGRKSFLGNFPSSPVALNIGAFVVRLKSQSNPGKQNHVGFVVKASGETSESSTSITIIKSVQNVWDKSEDRLGLIGLGFAAVVAVWASANLISAIDKLPLIPSAMELIGILFSSWFVYRYLLFKPDREELLQILSKSISDVLGQ